MANTFAGTSRVFVGNLAYNTTEQALHDAFSTVGPVISARLVFDKETGKMKGFGFVEYRDYETAMSAVRNLSGYEIEGRGIRVDYAEPEKTPANRRNQNQPQAPGNYKMMGQQQQQGGPPPSMMMKGALPSNLPTGIPVPPGMSATDSITQTLATMPPDQLLDILSQMKSLVTTSPEQARNLLNSHPSLSYALFQAMVLMKVVDPAILQRMLAPSLGAPTMNQPPPQQQPYSNPAPSFYNQSQQSAYNSQPPYAQQMPPMQQQPQAPVAPGVNAQTQAQLLQQVLSMTQAQIDSLPPKDRETVMALRASLGQR